jgi:hypothetical protein
MTEAEKKAEKRAEKYKLAIGELLRLADNISKPIISAYDPDASHKVNQGQLGGRKFSADALEACAMFLKIKTRIDRDKIYSNKLTLADRIILKIESFFEAECNECLEMYTNHLDAETEPPFICFLCMQGSHDCKDIKKICTALGGSVEMSEPSKGITWLCKVCFDKNNLLTPTSKRKESVSFGDDTLDEPKKNEQSEEEERVQEENEEEPTKVDYSAKKVCKLYLQMKCPHGLTGKREIDGARCKHNHPPRCHKYCGHGPKHRLGCNKGKSCKYYHPVICKFSMRDRRCFNLDCSYTHLKGTERYDMQDRDSVHYPERNRPESVNRDGRRPHTETRQRTYSNASSVKDGMGSRRRTYSNASTNVESQPRPQTPASRYKPSNHTPKNQESDFLEKRFRAMEDQLEEIKRLFRPPNPMQPPWNPMLADTPYMMHAPLYPTQQPQMLNNPHPHQNMWNQSLPQLQSNINSAC